MNGIIRKTFKCDNGVLKRFLNMFVRNVVLILGGDLVEESDACFEIHFKY